MSHPYSPSLDQIRPGGGYTPDNTRLVCDAANRFMKDYGLETVVPISVGIAVRQAPEQTADALRAAGYLVVRLPEPIAA